MMAIKNPVVSPVPRVSIVLLNKMRYIVYYYYTPAISRILPVKRQWSEYFWFYCPHFTHGILLLTILTEIAVVQLK